MRVENDAPRLISLDYMEGEGKHRLRKRLKLMPGVNEVDEDAWKKATASPAAASLVKDRTLIVDGPAPTVVVEQTPPPSKHVGVPGNVGDAKLLIGGTEDMDQLESWAGSETRSTVLTAIDSRIEALGSAGL